MSYIGSRIIYYVCIVPTTIIFLYGIATVLPVIICLITHMYWPRDDAVRTGIPERFTPSFLYLVVD